MKIKNKSWDSAYSHKVVRSHINKYHIDLKSQERTYVGPETMHPLCKGRFAQLCRAKYELVKIEICGDKLDFCTACAREFNAKIDIALNKPQKRYWQDRFKAESKVLKKDRPVLPSQYPKHQKTPHRRKTLSKLKLKDPIL